MPTQPKDPKEQIAELTGRIAALEQSSVTFQGQVQTLQEQLAQTQNQLALRLFTSNPATVNLNGGM